MNDVNVGAFSALDVRGPFEVCLSVNQNLAGPPVVRVEAADATLLQRVNVRTEDQVLFVDVDPTLEIRNARWPLAKVTTECRSVRCLRAAGAAKIDVRSVGDMQNETSLSADASGASKIRWHTPVSANVLELHASGASLVALDKGSAPILHARGSGSATISAEGLSAGTAHLHASGVSRIDVRARDLANAQSSGAAQVTINGGARAGVVSASGSSTITFD